MNQMRHIFVKDLRRLRWMLVAWFVIRAVRVAVDTAGADVSLEGFGPQIAVEQLSMLLSFIDVVFLALFASRLVHEEPLVGRDAFWITRPILRDALMAAKLTFALIFFVAVPLAGDVIIAGYFSTPAADIAKTVPGYTLNHLLFVLPLIALAAITPSLMRFVLAIVAVVAALFGAMASVILTALFFAREEAERGDFRPPDPTPAVIAAILVILTALAVVIYQYRRRRVDRALVVAGCGIALTFVVPPAWPWSFARMVVFENAAPPPDDPSIVVSLDTDHPRVGDPYPVRRQGVAKKQVAAQALVTGVPPEYALRTIAARSRLELPGGTVLQTPDRQPTGYASVGGSAWGRRPAIEAALGTRLLATMDPRESMSEQWPTLLTITEDEFVRHRNESGRLNVQLNLLMARGVVRAALPLADGAKREVGNRHLSIARVIRRATSCTVLFRSTHVEPLFSRGEGYSDLIFALRNNARREAVVGDSRELSDRSFSMGPLGVMTLQQIGGRGFVLQQYEQEFPARRPDDASATLDDQWMRDAELVMIEMIPAGVITRSLVAGGFRMAP